MSTKLYIITERDEKFVAEFKETYGHCLRFVDDRTFESVSFPHDLSMFHGISEASAPQTDGVDAELVSFLSNYSGSNQFVQSVKTQFSTGRRLSPKQMEAIRKFLSQEQAPKLTAELDSALRAYSGNSNFINSIKEQHLAGRTLSPKQIESVSKSLLQVLTPAPAKIFSLKTGDYVVVNKFMASKIGEATGLLRPHYGLEILAVHHETEKAWLVDAKLSAKKTCYCAICGIELTNPTSRARGIGPICAEKVGVGYSETSVAELEDKLVDYKVQKVWIAKKCVKELTPA